MKTGLTIAGVAALLMGLLWIGQGDTTLNKSTFFSNKRGSVNDAKY